MKTHLMGKGTQKRVGEHIKGGRGKKTHEGGGEENFKKKEGREHVKRSEGENT